MKTTNKEIADTARLLIIAKLEKKKFKKELRKFRENNECQQIDDSNHHCIKRYLPFEQACEVCKKADAIWKAYSSASRCGASLIRKLEKLCK
jgi:hypothetical protein